MFVSAGTYGYVIRLVILLLASFTRCPSPIVEGAVVVCYVAHSRKTSTYVRGVNMSKINYTWYLYLARCADGSLYCGVSKDVEARIAKHNAGTGAKYIRGKRIPATLVVVSKELSYSDALKWEREVKKLKPAGKENYVRYIINAPK